MISIMGIVNVTPDSFWEPSRAFSPDAAVRRVRAMLEQGADIIDIGAVSTRPGAAPIQVSEEWARLSPVLTALVREGICTEISDGGSTEVGDSERTEMSDGERRTAWPRISIDTTSAEIVRRCYETIGRFLVNDISAGEDDPDMLPTVGGHGLPFVAMHKRGGPVSMDALCSYPQGVVPALLDYFRDFEARAGRFGIRDWILDPGLGFAKTPEQCWEILRRLPELRVLGRPILIGAADKRFTRSVPDWVEPLLRNGAGAENGTEVAHRLAIAGGAEILRVHDVGRLKMSVRYEAKKDGPEVKKDGPERGAQMTE